MEVDYLIEGTEKQVAPPLRREEIKKSYNLACIKCSAKYQSKEPDPYLCITCLEVKTRVAAEIDAKYPAGRTIEKAMSDLEIYEAGAKTITAPNGRKITFAMTKLNG